MKKIMRSFIALAMFTSLAGFTGCKKDVTPNVPNIPEIPEVPLNLEDPMLVRPSAPAGTLVGDIYKLPDHLFSAYDGHEFALRCLYSGDNFKWHKWNSATAEWEDYAAIGTGSNKYQMKGLTSKGKVDYYCFTYTSGETTIVSNVCAVESGTERTKKLGSFVFSDYTYSKTNNSNKPVIGYVCDIDYNGNPTKIVTNICEAKNKETIKSDLELLNVNCFFDNKNIKWANPTRFELQQILINMAEYNKVSGNTNFDRNNRYYSKDTNNNEYGVLGAGVISVINSTETTSFYKAYITDFSKNGISLTDNNAVQKNWYYRKGNEYTTLKFNSDGSYSKDYKFVADTEETAKLGTGFKNSSTTQTASYCIYNGKVYLKDKTNNEITSASYTLNSNTFTFNSLSYSDAEQTVDTNIGAKFYGTWKVDNDTNIIVKPNGFAKFDGLDDLTSYGWVRHDVWFYCYKEGDDVIFYPYCIHIGSTYKSFSNLTSYKASIDSTGKLSIVVKGTNPYFAPTTSTYAGTDRTFDGIVKEDMIYEGNSTAPKMNIKLMFTKASKKVLVSITLIGKQTTNEYEYYLEGNKLYIENIPNSHTMTKFGSTDKITFNISNTNSITLNRTN